MIQSSSRKSRQPRSLLNISHINSHNTSHRHQQRMISHTDAIRGLTASSLNTLNPNSLRMTRILLRLTKISRQTRINIVNSNVTSPPNHRTLHRHYRRPIIRNINSSHSQQYNTTLPHKSRSTLSRTLSDCLRINILNSSR